MPISSNDTLIGVWHHYGQIHHTFTERPGWEIALLMDIFIDEYQLFNWQAIHIQSSVDKNIPYWSHGH